MGGILSHIGPLECSYTFSETPTLLHREEDAKLWSHKTKTSLSFCGFLVQEYVFPVGEPVMKFW